MTRVLSIANSKGGVGKSTITMLLAAAFSKQLKKKVLILDTDSQESVTKWHESEKHFYDSDSLVTVERIMPAHVRMYLDKFGEDFDIVFIDVPRMTDGVKETANVQLLYYCDSILIPVLGSRLDVMSTKDFYSIVQDASNKKKEMGYEYTVFAFMNRVGSRKDNTTAKELLEDKLGIPVMNNVIKDLKIFTTPSLFESILDTKEGRNRFEPFYKEVISKLKIK